jgi:hypothetical protein
VQSGTHQVHEVEDLIVGAATIGLVGGSDQAGLVGEGAVDYIVGLASERHGHSVEQRMPGQNIRVEKRRRLPPVPSIKSAHGPARSTGKEMLAVGTEHVSDAEPGGVRLALMHIH